MPFKSVSLPPLWAWLLWLAAGLFAVSPGATVTVTATAAVTLTLFAALTLASAWRAPAHAGVAGDPRPARAAIRARIQRAAFLPQRDPDASGKPRPRAPGHCRTHA